MMLLDGIGCTKTGVEENNVYAARNQVLSSAIKEMAMVQK